MARRRHPEKEVEEALRDAENAGMRTYQFVLIVEGADLQSDEMFDAVFEAGCDDALVGCSNGVQFVDFDREAPSAGEAVRSAIAALEGLPGVTVVRIAGADLLSISDIATRAGRTRESVRLLIAGKRGPGGFPAPVTDPRDRYRLWRSSDVQEWFAAHYGEESVCPEAKVLAGINAELERRRTAGGVMPKAG